MISCCLTYWSSFAFSLFEKASPCATPPDLEAPEPVSPSAMLRSDVEKGRWEGLAARKARMMELVLMLLVFLLGCF